MDAIVVDLPSSVQHSVYNLWTFVSSLRIRLAYNCPMTHCGSQTSPYHEQQRQTSCHICSSACLPYPIPIQELFWNWRDLRDFLGSLARVGIDSPWHSRFELFLFIRSTIVQFADICRLASQRRIPFQISGDVLELVSIHGSLEQVIP